MEFDATFLIAAISFIVFVFIMNKIFYAPVLKIMRERQLYIEKNYDSAKENKQEISKQTLYRAEKLEETRSNARSIIAENSKKLKTERSKQISDYKEKSFKSINEEKDSLKNSALEAKEILKDNVVDIAKNISLKILGESFNIDSIDKSGIKEQ